MTDPVITVTPTVMDGAVVRWYRSLHAAQHHRPTLSASRDGVTVHARFLTDIPDQWIDAAKRAHRTLADVHGADLDYLATHRHRGVLNGPLEPVSLSEGADRG